MKKTALISPHGSKKDAGNRKFPVARTLFNWYRQQYITSGC